MNRAYREAPSAGQRPPMAVTSLGQSAHAPLKPPNPVAQDTQYAVITYNTFISNLCNFSFLCLGGEYNEQRPLDIYIFIFKYVIFHFFF